MISILLSAVDQLLALLFADNVRFVAWTTGAGMMSMGIYRWCSPQERLSCVNRQIAQLQQELKSFEGDFGEAMPLLRQQLIASLRRVGLSLWPSLVGGLPVVCVLIWMEPHFAYRFPPPGAVISVQFEPNATTGEVQLDPPASGVRDAHEQTSQLEWPKLGHSVSINDRTGRTLVTLPANTPTTRVSKRIWWWNSIFASPVGYLPADTCFNQVRIGFPDRQYLSFGPAWARSWLCAAMVFVTVGAVATKVVFKIR